MRSITLLSLVLVLGAPSRAQQAPLTPGGLARDASLRVDTSLRWLEARVQAGADARGEAAARDLRHRADGRVLVEVIATAGDAHATEARLRELGAELAFAFRDRALAWVAPTGITRLARGLPGHRLAVVPAGVDHAGDPGDGLTGADTYIAGGDDGAGIGVAIIDTEFGDLDLFAANGWVPGGWVERDFHPSVDFDDQDGDSTKRHGTLCYQTAAINAPGATYYLYLFDSTTTTTAAVLAHIAADPNIDVVSYSFIDFREGWDDGSGVTNAGVADITAAGKLFFCAGGNNAMSHWQGGFADSDADGWHDFSGADELASVLVAAGGGLRGYLTWDQSSGTPDYDLYFYDSSLNILASGQKTSSGGVGDFETAGWTNGTGSDQWVGVAVRHEDGTQAEFELYANSGATNTTFEYQVAAGSTVTPTNSLSTNCISVAAVDDDFYADANPNATNYSSRGPTNGGAVRPDLTGPTGTLAGSSGSFIGTSAACPNVAGAAATLWSSAPYLDATGVRLLLVRQAELFKDWGSPGKDNTFGRGGVFLAPWAPGTRWVDRVYGDPSGIPERPYKFVVDAHDAAPGGGRLLVLGGTYPESLVLDKPLTVETAGPLVTLGD